VYLTKEEERLLEDPNPSIAKAMEILIAVGKIFKAEKLVSIKSAHVSGISYQNIGDEGLEWLEGINAKVRVRTTINPAGIDLKKWKKMNVSENFYQKQMRILNVFKKLGADLTLTCTPYLIYQPEKGDILAWSESSAIIYANSVLGARTNRESGITALAAAIIGKTPYYGLLLEENRIPNILIKYNGEINYKTLSLLGLKVGEILKADEIPVFKFKRRLSNDEMKILGASLASAGDLAIFHIADQTPEARTDTVVETLTLEIKDETAYCDPDVVVFGCPHLSKDELLDIYRFIAKNGKVKRKVWLFTSRHLIERNKNIVDKLELNGVEVFADTCIVVSPLAKSVNSVLTNSGKAYTYLPKLRGVKTYLASTEDCLKKMYD